MRLAFASDFQLRDDRLGDRQATLDAFARELEARNVETLVIAGDVFHYRRPGVDELAVFRRWLLGLPIDVILVAGNHDHRGPGKPTTIELFDGERNGGPSTVVFRYPDTLLLRSMVERPDVVLGILPWAHPGTVAAAGLTRRDQADALLKVAEGLARDVAAKPFGADPMPVLVTHHALDGTKLPTGLPVRELMSETILDTRALLEQGWRFIFAGHVHADGVALELGGPGGQAAYSIGVPWRHDFGEERLEPGFLVLDSAEGTVEKVPLPDRPMVTLDYGRLLFDWRGDPPFEPFQDGFQELGAPAVHGAIARVRIQCSAEQAGYLSTEAIRRRLLDAGAAEVKVVVEVERDTRARLEAGDEAAELEPAVALEGWIAAQELSGDEAEALRRLIRELLEATA